jgi:hypothetical protein
MPAPALVTRTHHACRSAPTPLDSADGAAVAGGFCEPVSPRDGAWVAEITGTLDLTKWPQGSHVIVRRERNRRRHAGLPGDRGDRCRADRQRGLPTGRTRAPHTYPPRARHQGHPWSPPLRSWKDCSPRSPSAHGTARSLQWILSTASIAPRAYSSVAEPTQKFRILVHSGPSRAAEISFRAARSPSHAGGVYFVDLSRLRSSSPRPTRTPTGLLGEVSQVRLNTGGERAQQRTTKRCRAALCCAGHLGGLTGFGLDRAAQLKGPAGARVEMWATAVTIAGPISPRKRPRARNPGPVPGSKPEGPETGAASAKAVNCAIHPGCRVPDPAPRRGRVTECSRAGRGPRPGHRTLVRGSHRDCR